MSHFLLSGNLVMVVLILLHFDADHCIGNVRCLHVDGTEAHRSASTLFAPKLITNSFARTRCSSSTWCLLIKSHYIRGAHNRVVVNRLIEQEIVHVLMSVIEGFDISATVLLFLRSSNYDSLPLRWSRVESFTITFGLICCDNLAIGECSINRKLILWQRLVVNINGILVHVYRWCMTFTCNV